MKKRRLEIRLVKDDNSQVAATPDQNVKSVDVSVETISQAVESTIKTVGMVAVGHVILDTLRQVLVAKATSK